MTVASDSWRRIRRLRATPPFVAARDVDPRRTRVFQAALTQAEELWEAASAVGAASRPLPLFYCLSQAGRAICAAWKTESPWEPTGHGLSSRRQPDDVDVASFAVRVTGEPEPMFGSVTDATGKQHLLETRPNVLHRLAHGSDEQFHDIYRLVI